MTSCTRLAALLLGLVLILASACRQATAQTRDWSFIQATGGISISDPVKSDGHTRLPVIYDPSGLTAVTQQPTGLNSALTVYKIKAVQDKDRITLHIVTALISKGGHSGPVHHADLAGIPPGAYTVYYETAGDPGKYLGKITLEP